MSKTNEEKNLVNNEEELNQDSIIMTEGGVQLKISGLATISKKVKDEMIEVGADRAELRFLVDSYYQAQSNRIATDNQIRAIMQGKDGDGQDTVPAALQWVSANMHNQEKQIQKMLDAWTDSDPVAQWAKSIVGIGPTISAALLAYFDIDRARYAGQFWSYAGLNDNNNPWLGREKASALVKETYTEVSKNYDSYIKEFNLDDKDLVEVLNKYCGTEFYGETGFMELGNKIYYNEWTDSSNIQKKMSKFLANLTKFARSGVEDITVGMTLDYMCKGTHAPYVVLESIASKTGRPIDSIIKSSKNDDGVVTKDTLTKYLSKPPYNKSLKTLCYKIGQSFIKVSNKEDSLYGRLYKERRDYETQLNEQLHYKAQAESILAEKNIGKNTETYKCLIQGKLSPAHINMRAQRYAVKLFIDHLFECMYINKYGKLAPKPYVIDYMGHTQYIEPEVDYLKFVSLDPTKNNK